MKAARWNTLQTKSSLAVIVTAAVLIELISAIQFWSAREGIREEVENRAKSELRTKSLEIQNVMTAVEVAAKNHLWEAERTLTKPDSLYTVAQRLVWQNEQIIGCFFAFKPNFYPEKGYWYEPYVRLYADGTEIRQQIGGVNHDYTKKEFYTVPLSGDSAHWSEPYIDNDGAHSMVTTYSMPLHDSNGRVVGILGLDVSLDWLSSVINATHIYPSSYNIMFSRMGEVMAYPVESLVMRRNIKELKDDMSDTTFNHINSEMVAGKSGQAAVTDDNGQKNYVFYGPVGSKTGWSMAVVCADKEIYKGLRSIAAKMILLMLAGLVLLGCIMWRTFRGFRRLEEVNAEKERIGSELRIAKNIQMGMLPKIFPPYPDRDDVDIFGHLESAKEVGGDLYDFYIRDEKLFFAIGDVSGKGVPASLVMAVTRSMFRTVSAHETSPERIISQMNDAMAYMTDTNMFVTFFVGVLDLPTGRLHYCNAGHCAPLLVSKDVKMLPVETNLPVGAMSDWKFIGQKMVIEPQTTIFLYTDGLIEAERTDNSLFGKERMMEVAKRWIGDHSPQAVISQMGNAIKGFVGDNFQSDDLTMLAIQYTKVHHQVLLQRSITLPNDIKSTPQLNEFVETICGILGFDMPDTMKIVLAIEEATVNVMKYAFPEGMHGEVTVEAQANEQRCKFTITDAGIPFDPTARPEVDTTLPAEDRPIGGLGIHLIRQIMDTINYERTDGKNILTLRKKLNKKQETDKN